MSNVDPAGQLVASVAEVEVDASDAVGAGAGRDDEMRAEWQHGALVVPRVVSVCELRDVGSPGEAKLAGAFADAHADLARRILASEMVKCHERVIDELRRTVPAYGGRLECVWGELEVCVL